MGGELSREELPSNGTSTVCTLARVYTVQCVFCRLHSYSILPITPPTRTHAALDVEMSQHMPIHMSSHMLVHMPAHMSTQLSTHMSIQSRFGKVPRLRLIHYFATQKSIGTTLSKLGKLHIVGYRYTYVCLYTRPHTCPYNAPETVDRQPLSAVWGIIDVAYRQMCPNVSTSVQSGFVITWQS